LREDARILAAMGVVCISNGEAPEVSTAISFLLSVHVLRFGTVASVTFLSISVVLLRSLYDSLLYNPFRNEDLLLRIMGLRP
jgi:hypothetical protein